MPRHKTADRDATLNETRRLLLEAATAEIASVGYASANIDQISKAAGFAKGTIYNYFPSKRALMLALLEDLANLQRDFTVPLVESETDPARRLERFFEAGFAFVAAHPAKAQIIVSTLYGTDTDFKRQMNIGYQWMFGLLGENVLGAGIAQGQFRQLDIPGTISLLLTIYLGIAASYTENYHRWLTPAQVSDFVLHALHQNNQTE